MFSVTSDGGQADRRAHVESSGAELGERATPSRPAETPAEKLAVFISYSRHDGLEFANQLAKALDLLGHAPSIDLEDISGAEEWQPRLREMIVEADTVVFVMSPESAISKVCEWEVEESARLGKRIIAVIAMPLGEVKPPERLQRLNYIHFYSEPRVPGSGFGQGLQKLHAALKVDFGWLREHRALLMQAEAWLVRDRDPDRLLRGGPLAAAERWAASRPLTAPDLTDTQRAYLAASRAAEDTAAVKREREVAERERLAREAIESARLAEAEAKRAEDETKARKAAQDKLLEAAQLASTRFKGLLALSVLAFALIAGVYIFYIQRGVEEDLKLKAQRTESGLLANAAFNLVDSRGFGSAGNAVLLALEALPDPEEGQTRAHVPLAEVQLARNLRLLREHAVLTGHTNSVKLGKINRQGTHAVTYSDDRTARLWDVVQGRQLALLDIAGHSVVAAGFSPDGSSFAIGQGDGTVRIFETATGALRARAKKHWGGVLALNYDADGKRIVTTSVDNTALIWDAVTGTPLARLNGHHHYVVAAVFSRSGDRIATASHDKTVRVWNATTGEESLRITGHAGRVTDVAFATQGDTLVSASEDGTVRVWNLTTGREVQRYRYQDNSYIYFEIGGYDYADFGHRVVTPGIPPIISPDGQFALTTDIDSDTAVIWDVANDRETARIDLSAGGIARPMFSSDGTRLLTVERDLTVGIRDTRTGAYIGHFDAHRGKVTSVAASQDGARVLTTSTDGTARIWEGSSRYEQIQQLENEQHDGATLSADNTRLVTTSRQGTARMWDVASGSLLATFQVIETSGDDDQNPSGLGDQRPRASVTQASFSPKGDAIAFALSDGTVSIWNTATERQIDRIEGHDSEVWAVSWSSDGASIATASQDGTGRIIDLNSGRELLRLMGHGAAVNSIRFDPVGKHVVTASEDNTARVWELATGYEKIRVRGHSDKIWSADFSPDGTRIVTASNDRTARVWNAGTGVELVRLEGLSGPVWSATFSDDGEKITTTSPNGVVGLWNSRTGELQDLITGGQTRALAAALRSRDGHVISTWSDGTLRVSQTFDDLGKLVAEAKRRVHRCLTTLERGYYFLPESSPSWCERRRLWPYDPSSFIYSANIANSDFRLQRALSEVSSALNILNATTAPDRWQLGAAHLARGIAREKSNDLTGARDDFQKAVKLGHDVSQSFLDTAADAMKEGRHEQALAAFASAREWASIEGARPEWKSTVHLELGKAFDQMDRAEDAQREFDLAGPDFAIAVVEYYLNKAVAAVQQDTEVTDTAFEHALRWASQIESAPDVRERIILARGLLRAEAGQFNTAVADFENVGDAAVPLIVAYFVTQSQQLPPQPPTAEPAGPASGQPADLTENMKMVEEALRWADRKGASKFDKADALMARGRIFARQGKLSSALDDYNAVSALGVRHSQLNEMLADLLGRLAREQLEQGQLDKAADNIESALEAQPKQPLLLASRGLVRARQGKCTRAIRDITTAMRDLRSFEHEISEQNLLLARGRCREKLGRSDAAIADYRRIVNSLGAVLARAEVAAAKERLQALGVTIKDTGSLLEYEDGDDADAEEFNDLEESGPNATDDPL